MYEIKSIKYDSLGNDNKEFKGLSLCVNMVDYDMEFPQVKELSVDIYPEYIARFIVPELSIEGKHIEVISLEEIVEKSKIVTKPLYDEFVKNMPNVNVISYDAFNLKISTDFNNTILKEMSSQFIKSDN